MTPLAGFRQSLAGPNVVGDIRAGLIGDDMPFETRFGVKRLLYADYVASGRALRQVEDFIARDVLPWYANSHTEASHCGAMMTRMREEARATIAGLVNAGADCHVVFTGAGATAGINRICRLLGLEERAARGERVAVLIGPYEHHSNILPWRESGAEVIAIAEDPRGGVDLGELEAALQDAADAALVVGSFSAASNVTGILTDPDPVTRLLKRHGALAVWDYAGGAPYLPMDMTPGPDCAKDAIVFSPHKFPGGPAASGVMVVRDTVLHRATPTAPGGGTVSFVSPWDHAYSARVSAREEAGTPNVIGDIRAALAMLVKDAIGADHILRRDAQLRLRGLDRLRGCRRLRLLGCRDGAGALPVFSFQALDATGNLVHQQLFTRMLSDLHGVQARGGCACAGPYAHALLGLDRDRSEALFARLQAGHELEKPGWVRLNLSYLHTDEQVDRILDAVVGLAESVERWAPLYVADPATARFAPREDLAVLTA